MAQMIGLALQYKFIPQLRSRPLRTKARHAAHCQHSQVGKSGSSLPHIQVIGREKNCSGLQALRENANVPKIILKGGANTSHAVPLLSRTRVSVPDMNPYHGNSGSESTRKPRFQGL
eukprot:scaffold98974_cov32-Tisochrysis_lutea.AAC.4